jgi:hypothetical protein
MKNPSRKPSCACDFSIDSDQENNIQVFYEKTTKWMVIDLEV